MKKISAFFVLIVSACFILGLQQENPAKRAYLIYDSNGSIIDYTDLKERALAADLIFFGEQHNSAIAHWLQFELIQDIAYDSSKNTTIGMEMFEADQQLLIDEYFAGLISQNSFENEARL